MADASPKGLPAFVWGLLIWMGMLAIEWTLQFFVFKKLGLIGGNHSKKRKHKRAM